MVKRTLIVGGLLMMVIAIWGIQQVCQDQNTYNNTRVEIAKTAPVNQSKWADALTAVCKGKNLDWLVCDYPETTNQHDWWAIAYPKGEWTPYCKEDGGQDYWAVHRYSSPENAAKGLLQSLKSPPNMIAINCVSQEDENKQKAIDQFRDKREWRGN